MKRSQLSRGSKTLERRTPLRSSPGPAYRAKPREPRTARPTQSGQSDHRGRTEEIRTRELVLTRSDGVCEICGHARATNMSHRKAAGRGGKWSPSNVLAACGMGNASGCHGVVHQQPLKALEMGWAVRTAHDPGSSPVRLARYGWVYLDDEGSLARTEAPEAVAA